MSAERRPDEGAALEQAGKPKDILTQPDVNQAWDLCEAGARKWAALGVPVFPMAVSWNEQKRGTDKRPLNNHGHRDATTDASELSSAFSRAKGRLRSDEWPGAAGVPGRAGFVVFDLDRHGGPDGVEFGNSQLHLPAQTYRGVTGSGGEHRWLRKRDRAVRIGNTSPWKDDGIDIRGDDGWVVVTALTPWGDWGPQPDAVEVGDECALVPEELWAALANAESASPESGASTKWRVFDPVVHLPRLHASMPGLLDVLAAEGAQVLAFRERPDGEPFLDISCDGRTIAATLGYVSPTGLNVFSSNWPGRRIGPQSVCANQARPTAAGAVVAPDRWFDRNGLLVEQLAASITDQTDMMRDLGDVIWRHTHGVWRPDRSDSLRASVTEELGDRARPAHTTSIRHFLLGRLPVIQPAPVPEYLNVENGLLNWASGILLPHDPQVVSTVQLEAQWEPSAVCPAVEAWLREVLPADLLDPRDDGPGFIWELFGYLCFSGNPLHKAVLLIGSGRNGKGTLLRLVTRLLGSDNVSSVDLHSLVNNRYRAAELLGKVANIAGDLDGRWLESTAVFKAITGGDSITAERKYGAPFDFTPFAVPVFSANKVFGTPDTSDGYLSRWIVVPFPNSFLGAEDRNLDARLQQPAELAGVLVKAVQGLRALMSRGNFLTPASVGEAFTRFADESDPVRGFLTDISVVDVDGWVTREQVWSTYRFWCDENGIRNPLTRSHLYQRLASAGWTERKRQGIRGFAGRTINQSEPMTELDDWSRGGRIA